VLFIPVATLMLRVRPHILVDFAPIAEQKSATVSGVVPSVVGVCRD